MIIYYHGNKQGLPMSISNNLKTFVKQNKRSLTIFLSIAAICCIGVAIYFTAQYSWNYDSHEIVLKSIIKTSEDISKSNGLTSMEYLFIAIGCIIGMAIIAILCAKSSKNTSCEIVEMDKNSFHQTRQNINVYEAVNKTIKDCNVGNLQALHL